MKVLQKKKKSRKTIKLKAIEEWAREIIKIKISTSLLRSTTKKIINQSGIKVLEGDEVGIRKVKEIIDIKNILKNRGKS